MKKRNTERNKAPILGLILGVIDTGALLASPKAFPVRADGRFLEVGLSQAFLEICD